MALPVPNLDDRRFQDLVDEAKRRVQQRCPEWTDHNVSDPGVTLIETFAYMVDQLIYRLNRVPDGNYLRFLDLIGVTLFPPTAARGDVTFWLSAPQEQPVVVPSGHPGRDHAHRRRGADRVHRRRAARHRAGRRSPTSPRPPRAGRWSTVPRSLLADRGPASVRRAAGARRRGAVRAVRRGTALRGAAAVDADVQGVGVDPRDPPWIWEAWDGGGWVACEVDRDATGGFNRAGDVVVHVPATHTASVAGPPAGRLDPLPGARTRRRASRSTAPRRGCTRSRRPPSAAPSPPCHAEVVRDETLGISDGSAGQRFALARRPVVAGDGPLIVEVAAERGWDDWREVASFAQSGPTDRHLMVDRVAGELIFGPTIREPDGEVRQYGAIPAKSAVIRVTEYRTGGGQRGNVARGVIAVQRDPLPFISTVTNRKPGDRRRGRRDGARGGRPRPAGAAYPRPRGHRRGLRATGPRGGAGCGAGALRTGRGRGSAAVRMLVVPAVSTSSDLEFDRPARRTPTCSPADRRLPGRAPLRGRPDHRRAAVLPGRHRRRQGPGEGAYGQRSAAHPGHRGALPLPPSDRRRPGRRRAGRSGARCRSASSSRCCSSCPAWIWSTRCVCSAPNPITGARGEAVSRLDLPANALAFSFGHQVRVERGT